ncbi:MAG: hypothetical protein WCX77_03600 [Candidatus Paceibacterota bacterium]|jgi:hypothetical protein
MKLKERLNGQLKKVQALPKKTKRIIFWSVIIVISLGLLLFWANYLFKTIKNFSFEEAAKDLNIQDISSKAGQATKIENEMNDKLKQLEQLKK